MKCVAPRAALIAMLLCGMTLTTQAQYTLSTPIDQNNGQDGVMFDVQNTSFQAIRITGIDSILDSGPQFVEVWYVTDGGSWVGKQSNIGAWTYCGSNTFVAAPGYVLTPLGIPLDIELAPGQTLGLYVTCSGAVGPNMRYTTGFNQFGLRAQSTHLDIFEGIGKAYQFGATYGSTTAGGSSRMFNGRIHYSVGSAGETASLVTTNAPSTSATGLFFDLKAEEPITVEGFSVDLQANTHAIEVWTVREGGSFLGLAGNASAWQLVGYIYFVNAPVAGRYELGLCLDVPIAAGQSRGFYVTRTTADPNDLRFTDLGISALTATATDGNLSVLSGVTSAYSFAPTTTRASFSGDVHYRRNLEFANTSGFSTSSLTTPGGINSAQGMFFDVAAAGSEFVQVTRVDAEFNSTGTFNLELWSVRNRTSHIGNETNMAAWEMIWSGAVNVTTAGVLTTVANDLRIVLEPGQVQGLYLTTDGSTSPFAYNISGSPAGTVLAATSFFEVRSGSRATYPFMIAIPGRDFGGRVFARRTLGTLDTFAEDFSGGSGVNPPAGWLTHASVIEIPGVSGWNFDDPQPIFPAPLPPIDDKFAVVDSDGDGSGSQTEAYLYSPRFDAGGNKTLSFDHYHRSLASTITVDVWDGTTWNNLISTSLNVNNSTKEIIDITMAAGGSSQARLRYGYVGNWDWHWALDNVRVTPEIGDGQGPRPGLAVLDVNFANETNGQPVASNLPGPYFADGYTSTPVVFDFGGEPNQPIILLQGPLNVNNFQFTQPFDIGKLDIGFFDPLTAQFQFVEEIANGSTPGFLNGLFFTSGAGLQQLSFPLPPFTAGNTYTFQAVLLSNFINAAFTNAVSLNVVN